VRVTRTRLTGHWARPSEQTGRQPGARDRGAGRAKGEDVDQAKPGSEGTERRRRQLGNSMGVSHSAKSLQNRQIPVHRSAGYGSGGEGRPRRARQTPKHLRMGRCGPSTLLEFAGPGSPLRSLLVPCQSHHALKELGHPIWV
jgi:hypothetical protein